MDVADIYEHFKKHPAEFQGAATMVEFADAIGGGLGELLRKYAAGWAGRVFETVKAHPNTFLYRPLLLPRARTFADLFSGAVYAEHVTTQKSGSHSTAPAGFCFVSATRAKDAVPCGHHSGTRYVVKFRDGTAVRGRSGAKFMLSYAKPRDETIAAIGGNLGGSGGIGSFEAVTRDDGILIIANAPRHLGSDWVALLNAGESLLPLMPPEVAPMLAAEAEADRAAWECIVKGEDGQEYLDESRCTVRIETR